MIRFASLVLPVVLLVSACHDHGEEHGHSHGPAGHHDDEGGTDHDEGAALHDEGAGHHGHGEGTDAFTKFDGHTELFVQIPKLVVGESAEIAAHFTWLDSWGAVKNGQLMVEYDGGGRVLSEAPVRPGVFVVTVTPSAPSKGWFRFILRSDGRESRHTVGPVVVYPKRSAVPAADEEDDGGVSFLKEQQWRTDFSTTPVKTATVRPAFEAYGALVARSDGDAWVSAPASGRLLRYGRFPRMGRQVRRGEVLGVLVPRLGDQGDVPALDSAVERARIELGRARKHRARLEGLLADGAVPERRVIDARFAEQQAQTGLDTAQRRIKQVKDLHATSKGDERGTISLRAPISGTVVTARVAPGAFVEEGGALFRIVDLSELWLRVDVTEAHVGRVDRLRGAWFEVDGLDGVFEVPQKAVVAVGGVIDSVTRTAPLLFSVPNPEHRFRVGMFAQVRVLEGEPYVATVVPVSSLLHEAGSSVVYVQLGGESFERRPVRVGRRDGNTIAIKNGLKVGERVVSVGAYSVRLAGSQTGSGGHGHPH